MRNPWKSSGGGRRIFLVFSRAHVQSRSWFQFLEFCYPYVLGAMIQFDLLSKDPQSIVIQFQLYIFKLQSMSSLLSWILSRWLFTLYHCKSPLNQLIGKILFLTFYKHLKQRALWCMGPEHSLCLFWRTMAHQPVVCPCGPSGPSRALSATMLTRGGGVRCIPRSGIWNCDVVHLQTPHRRKSTKSEFVFFCRFFLLFVALAGYYIGY